MQEVRRGQPGGEQSLEERDREAGGDRGCLSLKRGQHLGGDSSLTTDACPGPGEPAAPFISLPPVTPPTARTGPAPFPTTSESPDMQTKSPGAAGTWGQALPKAGVPGFLEGPGCWALIVPPFTCLRIPTCPEYLPDCRSVGSVWGRGVLGESLGRTVPGRWDGRGPSGEAVSVGAQTPPEGVWTGFKA